MYDLIDSLEQNNTQARITPQGDIENTIYRQPIKIWLHRNDDGITGPPITFPQKAMDDLNKAFIENNIGILFYMICEPEIVISTKLNNPTNDTEEKDIIKSNYVKGILNVHLISSMDDYGFYFDNSIKDGVAINYNLYDTITSTVMAHEIGHNLKLDHTHQHYDHDYCRAPFVIGKEAVSRSRKFKFFECPQRVGQLICSHSGDGFCDTPADPNIQEYDNSSDNCYWDGTLKDKWNDAYNPSYYNIMSYAEPRTCRNSFSPGQKGAMLSSVPAYGAGFLFYSYNTYDQTFLFDRKEPDNIREYARLVSLPLIKDHHTFHWNLTNGWKPEEHITDCDVDWVRFNVSASGFFRMETESGFYQNANTIIDLYNSLGQWINSNDDGAGNGYSKLEVFLNYGTYFLKISHKPLLDNKLCYDYKLSIIECNPLTLCIEGDYLGNELRRSAKNSLNAPCLDKTFISKANTTVVLKSEVSVVMNPGFIAEFGTSFIAKIGAVNCEDYKGTLLNEVQKKSDKAKISYLSERVYVNEEENSEDDLYNYDEKGNLLHSFTPSPNPFSTTLDLNFSLPTESQVQIHITDALGVLVYTHTRTYDAGEQKLEFDAMKLPSGMYFVQFSAGDFHEMKKVIKN